MMMTTRLTSSPAVTTAVMQITSDAQSGWRNAWLHRPSGASHGQYYCCIITQESFCGNFYRAMLCIRGTSHGPVSVCLCLSVTSQSSTKTAKRRITQTTPHDTPRNSSFLVPKISAKFDRGHPLRRCRMQVGWVKIDDFWLITGCISKTVQDRHILPIEVE